MVTEVGQPQTFKYETPESEAGKVLVHLFRTDIAEGLVHVVSKGGENNLHSHSHQDGFWMVLVGRARFYGEGDRLIADLGKNEGVLIPRGYRYWFESASDEPLQVLQVIAFDRIMKDERVVLADRADHAPKKASFNATRHIQAGLPERAQDRG